MSNHRCTSSPEPANTTLILWPWTMSDGHRFSLKGVLASRRFSLSYLMISWSLVALFGFASNRDCRSSWQLEMLCDAAIWLERIITDPGTFFLSLITSPWIHNGEVHLLFVTLFGIMIFIQSFEAKHGWRLTTWVFITTHLLIGITFAIIFNIALTIWPDHELITYGFERNWMGGSVGMFGIIGAFAKTNRNGRYVCAFALLFECVNFSTLGTSIHISLIHVLSIIYGYVIARYFGNQFRFNNEAKKPKTK